MTRRFSTSFKFAVAQVDDGSWKKKRDALEDRCKTVEVVLIHYPWFLHSTESCTWMWMPALSKRRSMVVRLKKAHNRFKKLPDPGQVREKHAVFLSWQVSVRQDNFWKAQIDNRCFMGYACALFVLWYVSYFIVVYVLFTLLYYMYYIHCVHYIHYVYVYTLFVNIYISHTVTIAFHIRCILYVLNILCIWLFTRYIQYIYKIYIYTYFISTFIYHIYIYTHI